MDGGKAVEKSGGGLRKFENLDQSAKGEGWSADQLRANGRAGIGGHLCTYW